MRDQVLLANAMLAAIDGRHERTFTVPCGDAVADGGNYVDLVAPDFVAIKLGSGAVVPDMAQLDPHAVTVEAPVGATGAQLIALVEEAGRSEEHTSELQSLMRISYAVSCLTSKKRPA